MVKIATPISHLFRNQEYAKRLIANSDCLERRHDSISINYHQELLFHSDLEPNHELKTEDFEYLDKIRAKQPQLKLLTFHCATSCSQPYIKNGMFQVGGKEYTRNSLLKNARDNFKRLKEILGPKVNMAIENNNFYPTRAYQYVTEAEFIAEVVYENKIAFLFDLAHARITAHNKKIDYDKYLSGLPMDKLVQIHLSAEIVSDDGLAYDAHNCLEERQFDEVKNISRRYPAQYLTIEYYKDIRNLINLLIKAKEIRDEVNSRFI